MGDKIEAADKQTIEDAVAKLKTALAGTDIADIKSATDELQKAFYAVSEKIYSNQNAQPGGDSSASYNAGGGASDEGGSNDGQYYDADYEVVDDDEKK